MQYLKLFIDDGGVISNNSVRGPQCGRLLAHYFAPLLGGSPDAWADANRVTMNNFFAPGAWQSRIDKHTDYAGFQREYYLDWMETMCSLVGIEQPGEEESIRLAEQSMLWMTPQVNAAFPGAAEAIKLLHEQGYVLYTASGEASSELRGYLGAIGVRDYFRRLYGPDLVNTPSKCGPIYYERAFADVGVVPGEAQVVDDSLLVLRWAVDLGARGVLVSKQQEIDRDGLTGVIACLADLPGLLDSLR